MSVCVCVSVCVVCVSDCVCECARVHCVSVCVVCVSCEYVSMCVGVISTKLLSKSIPSTHRKCQKLNFTKLTKIPCFEHCQHFLFYVQYVLKPLVLYSNTC